VALFCLSATPQIIQIIVLRIRVEGAIGFLEEDDLPAVAALG